MKKNVITIVIVAILAIVLIAIGIANKGKSKAKRVIAVIPKGTTHIYWQSVKKGAQQAAKEANVEISWNGPERESARERQIQIIEDFIVQKVSGIVLAPLDAKAIVPKVEELHNKKIPCVIIDSGVDTENYISFIATDNYNGGVLAAKRMGEILNGKGNIIVIKYLPGSDSTTNRENGFIDTIKKDFPEIKIVDSKYGLDTAATAMQATEDLLTKNVELDGLYACNASTAVGALQALKTQGRTDKIKMVGFDSEKALIDGLEAGYIDALVVQNPFKMGYEGVMAIVATLDGKKVEKRIDTGIELITKENLQTPEIQALLK